MFAGGQSIRFLCVEPVMAMNTSLAAIPGRRFDEAAARHLLLRVGYGGTPRQVREFQAMGLNRAVERLVHYAGADTADLPGLELDADVLRKQTDDERKRYQQAKRDGDEEVLDEQRRFNLEARREDRQMMNQLRRWWVDRMLDTPRPAEERLTLLWHGHFASSYRNVTDAYLMQRQNQLLRQHANGSFADLARGVVRDPAMIKYLNNDRNNKNKPNENLARELMELFTLGVGHYSEDDIKEGARALTGYGVDDNDFAFHKRQHDDQPKRILGREDNFDGDGFVDLLLSQAACAQFVAVKLYDTFVADVGDVYESVSSPHRSVIDRIAGQLRKNDYQIAPVLADLFKSQLFYDDSIVSNKIKDPVQLTVGTIRSLDTPRRDRGVVEKGLSAMGQVLFEPPTVNGWDGGRAWINTSTLFVRQNLCTYLISGKHPNSKVSKDKPGYDPMSLLADLDGRSPEVVTDFLIDHLVGSHTPELRRAPAKSFMKDRTPGDAVTSDDVIALLCLITAMPEYQLC